MGSCCSCSRRPRVSNCNVRKTSPVELPPIPTSPKHVPIVNVAAYLSRPILEGGPRLSTDPEHLRSLNDTIETHRRRSISPWDYDDMPGLNAVAQEWEEAVKTARQKIEEGESLGFDLLAIADNLCSVRGYSASDQESGIQT